MTAVLGSTSFSRLFHLAVVAKSIRNGSKSGREHLCLHAVAAHICHGAVVPEEFLNSQSVHI